MKIENEQCWMITGMQLGIFWIGKLRFMSEGETSEVQFTADDVFDQEERKKNVLGFLHTHPATDAFPSATDHATMKAWVTAMGKPLVCGIIGNDGLKSYYYPTEDSEPNEGRIIKAGTQILGVNPIV